VPYFGVFVASSSASGGFSTSLNQEGSCPLYVRSDNSVANWTEGTSLFSYRKEIIQMASAEPFVANLGADAILCDVTGKLLSPVFDPNNKTFLWSTGLI
jgi:hypothetical protein